MFNIFKKQYTDYIKLSETFTQKINQEYLNYCKEKESDKNTLIVSMSIKEINSILYPTTIETKRLLDEKGFSRYIEDITERAVLLQTEISELADAVKKGLGSKAEADELADIVIRACNFLCLHVTDHDYEKLSCLIRHEYCHNEILSIPIHTNDKYASIHGMMIIGYNILKEADKLLSVMGKFSDETFQVAFVSLWNHICILTLYCSAYQTIYIPNQGKLQECIESKMRENFARPYKFNTSEEIEE